MSGMNTNMSQAHKKTKFMFVEILSQNLFNNNSKHCDKCPI